MRARAATPFGGASETCHPEFPDSRELVYNELRPWGDSGSTSIRSFARGVGAYLGSRRREVFFLLVSACSTAGFKTQMAISKEVDDPATAERLVADALRAEAAGDATRRSELLRDAVAVAPDYSPARWHSGQVTRIRTRVRSSVYGARTL